MPSRQDNGQESEIFVAAFGKHPGWDDHIDDLGLDTEALVAFKRFLYSEGLASNIDSGKWEALSEDRRLDGFRHVFLWTAGGNLPALVLGRMWSSRDGKGRTRYPMIVCAQCAGLSVEWAVRNVLPVLAELELACTASSTADQVRQSLDASRRRLRSLLRSADDSARSSGNALNPIKALSDAIDGAAPALQSGNDAGNSESIPTNFADGGSSQGMLRLLYQIEREMSGYRAWGGGGGKPSTSMLTARVGGSGGGLRAHHMRVPLGANNASDACLLWLSFMLTQLHASTPMLLLLRMDEAQTNQGEGGGASGGANGGAGGWVDIVVGPPGPAQLFCLRAGLAEIPLVTEIPYTFEPEFTQRASDFITEAKLAQPGAGVRLPVTSMNQRDAGGATGRGGGGGLLNRLAKLLPRFNS